MKTTTTIEFQVEQSANRPPVLSGQITIAMGSNTMVRKQEIPRPLLDIFMAWQMAVCPINETGR